ncbi:aminotransferase class I/II-fold pyridoxal phosphate-dependent enzyme, partial [uncultured Veillonella sp.]|uniref:aminotransferase class I/II-fold pyridoxal phosphate-dependent enzyme n=1 Tax=uncultured Veillonella sp. TaxID=159268 RepID=UPI0026286775
VHEPYKALAYYDTKGQVVFMGSLSKTLSPGLRLGWLKGTQDVIQMLSLVKEQSDIHSSIPDHVIAATYMAEYDYKGHVKAMCEMYKKRMYTMIKAFKTELPEFTFQSPEGGFFLWLALPEGIQDMAFFEAALDAGVLVIPGSAFLVGMHNKSYIRVNFSGVDEAQIVEAVKRLALAYKNMIK